MKKLIGITGILLLLFCCSFITPVLGNTLNEEYEELEINRKLLVVIGGEINTKWIGRELYGHGLIVYAEGNILFNYNFSIDFKGIPLNYNYYFVSICLYKPR